MGWTGATGCLLKGKAVLRVYMFGSGSSRLISRTASPPCLDPPPTSLRQSLHALPAQEFPARSRDYYRAAIEQGCLRLEGKPSSPDTILAPGQRMRHAIHRHEPPCLGGDIPVLGVTPGLVAVGKPAGMPVHVSGQYRKNTVLGVLQAHRTDLGPLHPCHRLDKPVSGVLIFARSPAAADALRLQIEAGSGGWGGGGAGVWDMRVVLEGCRLPNRVHQQCI